MFITRDAHRSPISAFFLADGEAGWLATELSLQRVWFLVQLEEVDVVDDPKVLCSRTVLLFEFQSVERLIFSDQSSKIRLKSVHIVTPGHVNGSDSWKMDQLCAVWQCHQPADGFEIPMDIFETVSGEKYPASFSQLSADNLTCDFLKFDFSI